MSIADEEEEFQDFEWFAIDSTGAVAFFTSGGRGFLPQSVKMSRTELEKICRYFNSIAAEITSFEGPFLARLGLESRADMFRPGYERVHGGMSKKGLYSFDCHRTGNIPCPYSLLTKPIVELRVEQLPRDISKIISNTVYYGKFADEIDVCSAGIR
ncbi:hypothetical protein NA78x_004392 [Anatilimnocola sp. NA78]|uniref:hypothetical protein n=1 Tax=Anatilimnocola sp. NA78 TaxID=3415683 RepID=UPI003CE46BA5